MFGSIAVGKPLAVPESHFLYLYMGDCSTTLLKGIRCVCVCLVAQLCPTLCNTMDRSPSISVHGILQAGILEWVAIPFSRGSS